MLLEQNEILTLLALVALKTTKNVYTIFQFILIAGSPFIGRSITNDERTDDPPPETPLDQQVK